MPRLRYLFLVLALLAGCATSEEATDGAAPRATVESGLTGVALERAREDVRTVQLYRSGDEASLPVVGLRSGQSLTLEFDLLDSFGEPLSVYFYHTDRHWRRQLLPVEYLTSFQSDDLVDYEASIGTRVRYAHYEYAFPNRDIQFTRSGNYIVRVTEQGNEQAVLFERAFFLTEEAAEVEFGIEGGLGGTYLQPVARIAPPAQYDSPIYDYDVCFARNGRFDLIRCAEEPMLLGSQLFQFYLPREAAFQPDTPLYDLDLSLLQAGPDVVEVDLSVTPYAVTLAPDYARFGGGLFDDRLTGQTLVSSVVFSNGDTQGEYADVTFTYVPQGEQQLAGPVILTGSFNGWVIDPEYAMTWNAAGQRYEATLLLKQGRYVYKYYVDDPVERERIRREVDIQPNLYTALVYLHDPTYNTDRLLAVRNVLGQ